MWMLDTVRLQQILTTFLEKKKKDVVLLLGRRRMSRLLCDSAQVVSPH